MSIIRINGGKRLYGTVKVSGSKNSVLPILSASLLTEGKTVLHNCPNLSDVDAAIKILNHLGCKTEKTGDTITIYSRDSQACDVPDSLMREMRSSVIFLGAILAKVGMAVLSMPGGCELGPRPIDLHLKALRDLGAEIREEGGNLICHAKELTGCRIDLAIPSVGATENSMIAACAAKGTTIITNAAREPEIRDLGNFLNLMGYKVHGAGTSVITVMGGKPKPGDVEYTVMPDRIVAATYMAAAAGAGGDITLTNVLPGDVECITKVLRQMGCGIYMGEDNIRVVSNSPLKAPPPIKTMPYPGFPTDAQPPMMAACLMADGTSVFIETIFENRFRHIPELRRMGANIAVDGRVAMVKGGAKLHGAPVRATDLRAGAALVVAALAAKGQTDISDIKHIERGYDDLPGALRELGADIARI